MHLVGVAILSIHFLFANGLHVPISGQQSLRRSRCINPPRNHVQFSVRTLGAHSDGSEGIISSELDNQRKDSIEKFALSTALGAVVGLSVVGLKLSISSIQTYAYNGYLEEFFSFLPRLADLQASSFVIAAIPALGGLAVSGLKVLGGPEKPLVLKDLAASGASVPIRAQLVRTASAAVTLGTGNSLGPEGPAVELGAAVARASTQLFPNITAKHADLLFACGAAGGVAAGFNAPIAACFFAIEVIEPLRRSLRSEDSEKTAGAANPSTDVTYVLLASAMAALTARVLLEERLSFKVAEYSLASPLVELPLYLGLGAVSGLIALSYKTSNQFFEQWWKDLDSSGAFPRALHPAASGLACGVVGLFLPQILFFGYATLDSILAGTEALSVPLLTQLCAAKLVLTALCATSGLVGGTFAPSLFLGATAGAAYQHVMASGVQQAASALVALQLSLGVEPGSWGVLPQLQVAPEQAYAMVGAASVLAAFFNAPLTGSLLLFELTHDFDVVLPLMASAGLASLISPPPPPPPPPPPSPISPEEAGHKDLRITEG